MKSILENVEDGSENPEKKILDITTNKWAENLLRLWYYNKIGAICWPREQPNETFSAPVLYIALHGLLY
jgi:hypothetical protein